MKRPHKTLIEVRESPVHGRGVYATLRIRKGARIIEYVGERISQEEGNRRYGDDDADRPHVLLFTVDDDTVIDAAVGGNEARFINHSCNPNCEAVEDGGRIFIEAIRAITPGQELFYDYKMTHEDYEDEETQRRYACRCGAKNCRATMLDLQPR